MLNFVKIIIKLVEVLQAYSSRVAHEDIKEAKWSYAGKTVRLYDWKEV